MKLDLNCDLGESEPPVRTRALMRWITSANIACGGHAGDAQTMERCVLLAKENGIHIGAHPGLWCRESAGRASLAITPRDIELLLLQQVGALERIAREHGAKLHHIKLHGALYHASEQSDALAKAYLRSVERWWPKLVIYALAGGRVARIARVRGCRVWDEAFADRGYRDDGTLVPRGEPGAVIEDAAVAVARVRRIAAGDGIESENGRAIPLHADTICIHGDTPGAVAMARCVGAEIRRHARR